MQLRQLGCAMHRVTLVLLMGFILGLTSFTLLAQNPTLDQIEAELRVASKDISQTDIQERPDSAIDKALRIISLYQQLERIDESTSKTYWLYLPSVVIGLAAQEKEDYAASVPWLAFAINVALLYPEQLVRMGLNQEGFLAPFRYLREAYSKMEDYDQAILWGQVVLNMCKSHFPQISALAQAELAQIYLRKGDTREGISIATEALETMKQYGNSVSGFDVSLVMLQVLRGLY